MKARIGFVSNSSSSSFIAICPIDLDPFKGEKNRKLLDYCFDCRTTTILGQNAKVYECYFCSEENENFDLEYAPKDALEEAGITNIEEELDNNCNIEYNLYNQATNLFNKDKRIFFSEEQR